MNYQVTIRDLSLAPHPRHAIFFALFAPVVYAVFVFGLAGMFIPGVADAARGESANFVDISWRMQVVLQFVIFAHVTLFADRIGAGPFSGRMQAEANWVIAAIILGPLLYNLCIAASFYLLAGGEENWVLRDEEYREFLARTRLVRCCFSP